MFASNVEFDLVVVGRVSMNKKKAKRNLQRIANQPRAAEVAQESPCEKRPKHAPPAEIEPMVPEVPAPVTTVEVVVPREEPKRMLWADMVSDDEDDFVLPLSPVKVQEIVKVEIVPTKAVEEISTEKVEEKTEKETSAKSKRTHRGGRSAEKRLEQEARKAAKAVTDVTSIRLATLPDAVLARIFEGVELQAVGAAAATGRALRSAVWESAGFWTHMSSDLAISCANGFRQWLFGLHGDWAGAFQTYCTSADPAAALGEAAYLAGGLVRSDDPAAFVSSVVVAAGRVTANWEVVTAALGSIVAKAADRPQVFGSSVLPIREAADTLRERFLLAKLSQDDAWTGFDPFAEEPVEFDEEAIDVFAEKEEDNLDLTFATSFLEMLDTP